MDRQVEASEEVEAVVDHHLDVAVVVDLAEGEGVDKPIRILILKLRILMLECNRSTCDSAICTNRLYIKPEIWRIN